MKPIFTTTNVKLQNKYNSALIGLASNCLTLNGYEQPVLIEGGMYPGTWLECGPMEGLIYGVYRPDIAYHSHTIFYHFQREDGYIPCTILPDRILTGQIQMVVPLAATALEVSYLLEDEEFLKRSYDACSRWDEWLRRYRNTRGSGLCEAFCEWDTGHDNSPRFKGLPVHCPDYNAALCPSVGGLPYLAPDLSSNVYGSRRALSTMARMLGKEAEAEEWDSLADQIQKKLLTYCYDAEEQSFFDLDRDGRFVRIRGDAMTRVLGEHVVDQELFEEIFRQHYMDPKRFWTPYPFPSISSDDPQFNREFTNNSWGGASQALTALRAPRWMEHYRKPAQLAILMNKWMDRLIDSDGFQQQMDPWTGVLSTTENYSPSMCLFIDFIPRLYGIRVEHNSIEWNCRIPVGADECRYSMESKFGLLELVHIRNLSILYISNRIILKVYGTCRIVTDVHGDVLQVVGTEEDESSVELDGIGETRFSLTVRANEYLNMNKDAENCRTCKHDGITLVQRHIPDSYVRKQ